MVYFVGFRGLLDLKEVTLYDSLLLTVVVFALFIEGQNLTMTETLYLRLMQVLKVISKDH